MVRRAVSAVTMLGLALLAGCMPSPKPTVHPDNQIQVVSSLGVPDAADGVHDAIKRGYALGPDDAIAVRVIGYDGFDTETVIDSNGRVELPLVGSVIAAGKSPSALSSELTLAYQRTYLTRATVTVTVKDINSLNFTIEGAVRMPGVYPVVGPMRLNGAIAKAQGLNEFAQFSNVAVFRTVNGQQYAAVFNLRDIRNGHYIEPEIYPNDTIIVGESQVRRLFRDVISIAPFIAVFRPFG